MRYQEIAEDLKERKAKVDSPSVAAVMTTEFQLAMGTLLTLFMLLRAFSSLAAVAVGVPLALISIRMAYSKTAFRENDDRFSTLLFYTIVFLVALVVLVGWRP